MAGPASISTMPTGSIWNSSDGVDRHEAPPDRRVLDGARGFDRREVAIQVSVCIGLGFSRSGQRLLRYSDQRPDGGGPGSILELASLHSVSSNRKRLLFHNPGLAELSVPLGVWQGTMSLAIFALSLWLMLRYIGLGAFETSVVALILSCSPALLAFSIAGYPSVSAFLPHIL